MRALWFLCALLLASTQVRAGDLLYDVIASNDYQVVWKGSIQMQSCSNKKETVDIGEYLFVCDMMEFYYLPYYGEAMLLATPLGKVKGKDVFAFRLCLKTTYDMNQCLKGSVYKK